VSPVKYEPGFYIPEDGILHSHRHEILKSDIALTGWALKRRRNVSPVKYEPGFYISEDGILHSYRRGNFKSYITLTGWASEAGTYYVSCEVRTGFLYPRRRHSS
jgi:hypothetical protein